MIQTSVRQHPFVGLLNTLLSLFRRQPQPRYQPVSPTRAYNTIPRRYPIPPERAHLYARAADEYC